MSADDSYVCRGCQGGATTGGLKSARFRAQLCSKCWKRKGQLFDAGPVRSYLDFNCGPMDRDDVHERLRGGYAMMNLNRDSHAYALPWMWMIDE